MNKERLQYLVLAYTEGNISYSEYDELVAFIHNSNAEDAVYEGMDAVWNSIKENTAYQNLSNDHLYKKIISDERFRSMQPQTLVKPKTHVLRLPWLRIAASIIIVAGIAALYVYLKPKPAQEITAAHETLIKFSVPAGIRKQLKLPDSSIVWLNGGSAISYPSSFSKTSREVFLDGEAFFDVVHDASKKFIVHTGNVNTEVLGTAFDINAYHKNISVTVLRGKVSVADSARQLAVLLPGKQLKYSTETQQADILDVNANDFTAWKNGELILDNINMWQAAEIIERWFNVSVEFKNNALKKCSITVSFLQGENIKEVMDVISQLNDFKYQIANNKVIITGKGCE